MFRAILFTQWQWTRLTVLIGAVVGFAIPVLSVGDVSAAAVDQARVGELLNVQRAWGLGYPVLATALGLVVALSAWGADHRGRHVYALSLPLPRWQYALLRLGAGLLLLAVPVVAVWLGGLVASAAVIIPPGLTAYPASLTARFAMAMLVAYSLFFAISAGTERTAMYVLGVIGGLILAQVLFSTFSELVFMDDVGNFMGRAGPVGIYLDRWMLIDV